MAIPFFPKRRTTVRPVTELSEEMISFLKQYPSPIMVSDEQGKIGVSNALAAKLLGARTLEGTSIEKWGVSVKQMKKLIAGNRASVTSLQLVTQEAEVVTVEARVSELAQTKQILFILEQTHQLPDTPWFLEKALNAYPQAVILQTPQGKCVLCNTQAEKLFGLKDDSWKGKNIYALLPKEISASLQHLDTQIHKEAYTTVVLSYSEVSGRTHYLRVSKVFVPEADGKEDLIVTVLVDETNQQQQLRDLRQNRALLKAILDNVPLGLYTRDSDHQITFYNRQSLKVLNEPDELRFNEPHAFQDEQTSENLRLRELEILKSGQTHDYPEEEYIDALGHKMILHLIKVPLTDAGPKPIVLSIVEDITQRCYQEKDLKRINGILSAIVHNMPIGLYARGENGEFLLRNKQCEQIFGVSSVSVFDKQGALPHEKPEQVQGYIQREKELLESGKILDIPEEEYITGDGQKKILHMIKIPVSAEEKFVVTLVEDITLRKEQESALVEAKNFLQTIIDSLPVSLSVKDADGKYILWNKKSEEVFGSSAKEVIGQPSYRKDLNKDQMQFVRETDARVFANHKPQEIAQEIISSGSEGVKIMHTVRIPVFGENDTNRYLLTVSEDITAKTKMEKQIREASDKNTLLLEYAREGVLITEDKKIVYANRALCALLGAENVKELEGKSLEDFVAPDFRVFFNEQYENSQNGQEQKPISLRFVTLNGKEIETEFSAVSSRYLGRKIVLCFMRDISSFTRAQRDLKHLSEGLQEVFESGIAPTFILQSNGYIRLMNRAARELFGFTEKDKKFYQNVYIRPALTLAARKLLKQGEPAEMNYVLDFDRAAQKFEGFIHKTGKLALNVRLVPIHKRDAKDGTVRADYVVFVQPQQKPLPPTPPVRLHSKPTAPQLPQVQKAEELLILPNSEPYVLCGPDFTIQVCNDLFCSLCQLSKEELIGQNIRYIMDGDSLPQFEADLKILQETGTLSQRDYAITPASGLEKNDVRLMGVKETDGRYLFVLRNMAFHRQIMRILEERSAQLNALLDSTDGIVFSISLPEGKWGHVQHANQFLIRKLGFSQEELARRPFEALFENTPAKQIAPLLSSLQKELRKKGKVSFTWNMLRDGQPSFPARVTVTALDLPNQETALVVVRDLAQQTQRAEEPSKEALELKSIREALPGLYIKADVEGKVLQVISNLPYWSTEEASKRLLNQSLASFFPKEMAARALSCIKESVSLNETTRFEFDLTLSDKTHYFDAQVSPITGQDEVVLWVTDISADKEYDRQLHNLYRLSNDPEQSLTDQVDKILQFGLDAFKMEVGFVLRFEQEEEFLSGRVLYVTPNELEVSRGQFFAVEECLQESLNGGVSLWHDLSDCACNDCIHVNKKLGAMAVAPLQVGGSVMGALCFASKDPRAHFSQGAEELMGILARLLSLRIELRETGKMLDESSRSIARTLEYVEKPAAMLDLDYNMTFVNRAFLDITGRHIGNVVGRNFFKEVIHAEKESVWRFEQAVAQAEGNSFHIQLDFYRKNGLYTDTGWEVFICKDSDGREAGYALIAGGR